VKCTSKDWKLVRDPTIPAKGERCQDVLDIYVRNDSWRGASGKARIYFMGNALDDCCEIAALAILLGIEERVRKQSKSMAFGGGIMMSGMA
jgi:hypothetical protein